MATARKGGMDVGTTVARINVKVSPDTKDFRRELKKDLDAIEKSVKGRVEIKADLDSAQARADFKRLVNQMKKDGKVKVGVDMVPGDGSGGKGGKGDGGKGGRGGRKGILPSIPGGFPSFGSGINPAGYVVILAAAALVAAPLIGLLSTAVLAIPGMISAIATPIMTIGLGLEGIKKAAAGSGLFKVDEAGDLDGLGAVFDPIKKEVSAAFDEGLTPSLKAIAAAIEPLLGSMPLVATGLTDMFRGFTESLTSAEGLALFDQTVKNIGKAFSDAEPGIRDFTAGMLGLATSFTAQLPAFSSWLNRTGDSFVKWVTEMTAIPDPAGHHGADPNGKAPLTLAFEGLGDTLETIGNWAIDMAKAGMEFVTDPKKMDDFVATLQNIGDIITNLVDIGNDLGKAWEWAGMLPGLSKEDSKTLSESVTNPKPPVPNAPPVPDNMDLSPKGFMGFIEGVQDTLNAPGRWMDKNFGWGKGELEAKIKEYTTARDNLQTTFEKDVASDNDPAGDWGIRNMAAQLRSYNKDITNLQEVLDKMNATPMPVDLQSFETPLVGPAGAGAVPAEGNVVIDQLLAGLAKVPPAAQTAKDAVDAVSGAGLTAALGQLSAGNQPVVPAPEAPVAPAAPTPPAEVPAPDLSMYQAGVDQIPALTTAAMGEAGVAAAAGVVGIAEALNGGTAVILAVVGSWPGVMQASLSSLYAIGNAAGLQIGRGLVDGMVAQIGNVTAAGNALAMAAKAGTEGGLEISSPSKVFIGIGEQIGEGLGVGMQNGFQPVLDQAKDLSSKISTAFADGSDPTRFLEGFTDKEAAKMEKVLTYQSRVLGRNVKSLDAQFKASGNEQFKVQADGIRAQIEQLAIQKDDLDLAQMFGELTNPKKEKSGNVFLDAINELMTIPGAFMSATADQAQQDLGMSGDGALQAVAGFGMDFAKKGVTNIFNTSNVEDTLSAHFGVTQRQSQGIVGR